MGYAASWFDLGLTFDFAVMTLTFQIVSRLYLRNHKAKALDI